MRRSLLPLALAAAVAPAHAQDLATDRPDFTESAVVVPLGALQVESGVTWERAGAAAFSGPEVLVRWAPLRRLELRLGAPDFVVTDGETGVTDGSVGLKAQLGPVGAWDVAAIATVLVPFGDEALGAGGGLDPALVLTAARDLAPRLGLGAQAGATWDAAADRLDLTATLVAGTDLSGRLGAFLEVAADGLQDEPALVLHHGYTLALGPDVQADVHAGVGLTEAAPDVFVGVGLSVRRRGRAAGPGRPRPTGR